MRLDRKKHTLDWFEKGISFVVVLSFFMFPLSVSAQTSTLENNTTGADSTNVNSVDVSSSASYSEANTSDTTNTMTFNLSTGNNTVSSNTRVGDVRTGDIALEAEATTEANTSTGALPAAFGSLTGTSVHAVNHTTGSGSTNTNSTTQTHTLALSRTNTSSITNSASVTAATGGNTIEDNTTVGNITTGSITGSVRFNSVANVPNPGPTSTPTPGPTTPPVGGGGSNPTTTSNPGVGGSVVTLASVATASGVGGGEVPQQKQIVREAFFPAGSDDHLPFILSLILACFGAVLTYQSQRKLQV